MSSRRGLPGSPLCMTASMKCQNTSGTQFHFDITPGVRLLDNSDLKQILGETAARGSTGPRVRAWPSRPTTAYPTAATT